MTTAATYEQILAYALAEAARRRQRQVGAPLDDYPPCFVCGGEVFGCELTTAGRPVLVHVGVLVPCGHTLQVDEQTVAQLANDVPQPALDLAAIGGVA